MFISLHCQGDISSGYFETLLQSDSFSENSEHMSTVKLPAEIAAHSPDFLDYLYALPSDSKFTINFENSKSMKSLANYFFIPRLIEDLAEFIEEDMKNYLIEHMEEYICELNSDTSDELSL